MKKTSKRDKNIKCKNFSTSMAVGSCVVTAVERTGS